MNWHGYDQVPGVRPNVEYLGIAGTNEFGYRVEG